MEEDWFEDHSNNSTNPQYFNTSKDGLTGHQEARTES